MSLLSCVDDETNEKQPNDDDAWAKNSSYG